jgi:hypothetical protein
MATLVARPRVTKRADDIFFTSMSVVMLAIVVVGFAPSYFLKGAVFAHLPSLLVHLHGAAFSTWIILFVVQSSLISAGNIRLHRKLGVFGAILAGLMVILGVLAPFGTIRRGVRLPPIFTPESFLIGNVLGILVFGAVVAVAIWKRNNRVVHKRLMFLANTMLMSPALSRMTFPIMVHYPFLIGVIPIALLVILFFFDLATQRRVLLVTVLSLVIYVGFDPVSDRIIATPTSHRITEWARHHP